MNKYLIHDTYLFYNPFVNLRWSCHGPVFDDIEVLKEVTLEATSPRTVGNVQALGANGKAAFSPKAHG